LRGALHFLKKNFSFFYYCKNIALCAAIFEENFFRCIRSEPLSDKRRSRAGDPRCIELAHPTGLFQSRAMPAQH